MHFRLDQTWHKLQSAYGGGPEVQRKVVCKSGSAAPVLEVYPMPIKVLANVGSPIVQHRVDLLLSCEATVQELKASPPSLPRHPPAYHRLQFHHLPHGIAPSLMQWSEATGKGRGGFVAERSPACPVMQTSACEQLQLEADDMVVWDFFRGTKYRCLDNAMDKSLEVQPSTALA